MARGRLYLVMQDVLGNKRSQATVRVYDPDGVTPFGDPIYDTPTSNTAIGNTLTADGQGRIIAYTDEPEKACKVAGADGVLWDADFQRNGTDQGAVDALQRFTIDQYMRSTDTTGQEDYNALQRAIDAAAAAAVNSGIQTVVAAVPRLYSVYRSVDQLGMSNVWVLGSGIDATVFRPTSNLNGGDDGVPTDPSQCHVFNASNGALALADYPHHLKWSDFTIDQSDTPGWDGLEYGFYIGHSRSAIEAQNVNYPTAERIKVVNSPTGITFGSSTPNFASAFLEGVIDSCVFDGTPSSIAHHYRYGLDDVAPTGIAAQMGVMRGGRFANNTALNPSGSWYAVVGNENTQVFNNTVDGYDQQVAAVGLAVGNVAVDFGGRHMVFTGNISNGAGGFIMAGSVIPSSLNGGVGEPSATGMVIDQSNIVTGTALSVYPAPQPLANVNGVRYVNPTGKDAVVIFDVNVGGSILSIKVGDRNDGSQLVTLPNTIRSVAVPNGMGITAIVSGDVTWRWYTARAKISPQPPAPLIGATQPFTYTNTSGGDVLITILPTATASAVPLTHLSIPPATGVTFTVGGNTVTPMGIRRNMLYLAAGATLSMTWTSATVQSALRGYHDATAVFTGWEWRVDSLLPWGGTVGNGTPAVPGSSGVAGTAYNAMGVPACVEVLTGTFSAITVRDSAGNITQTVQVESADPSTIGLKHFVVEPGGEVLVAWNNPKPTWIWYAAPNALLPQLYAHSGSSGSTLGQARDCHIGGTYRLAPSRGIQLVDFIRATVPANVMDASEWRPDYSVVLSDSGVTGGGCIGVDISGILSDSRTTHSVISHYLDNTTNTTNVRVRGYTSLTSGTAINPTGGGAGRVDHASDFGPGA